MRRLIANPRRVGKKNHKRNHNNAQCTVSVIAFEDRTGKKLSASFCFFHVNCTHIRYSSITLVVQLQTLQKKLHTEEKTVIQSSKIIIPWTFVYIFRIQRWLVQLTMFGTIKKFERNEGEILCHRPFSGGEMFFFSYLDNLMQLQLRLQSQSQSNHQTLLFRTV